MLNQILRQLPLLWRATLILLLVLILSRFMVVGLAKVLFNTQSSDGDESAYLDLGLALREEGKLTDGTRPPLYPLLLTPAAARDWSYFTWAKLITLGLGALTVLGTFIIGQRLFNWETGLLAAFLLASNREFHLRASTIYADTLLVLLFGVAWYFLIKSFASHRDGYLAGFFLGLAYLTKSSATLLLAAWGLTALFYYGRRILAQRQLLAVPLAFLLTSSPFLLYNWWNFGSPFYNFATTHVMWMDRWDQSQVEEPTDLPTFLTYLQTHTPADMLARLQTGLARLNPELAITLIPSRTLEPAWLGPAGLIGLLILTTSLLIFQRAWLGQVYHRRQLVICISLFLFSLFYISSAWYARVLIESRFLIPILGPFYLLLAAGVIGLISRLQSRLGFDESPVSSRAVLRWVYTAMIAVLLFWAGGWLIATTQVDAWSLSVNPFVSDRQANIEPESVLTWLIRDHPAEKGKAHIVFGPSKSLPLWKFPAHFNFERIPVEVMSWEALQAYLNRIAPDYIIIDSDTARRRRQALGSYFRYDDNGVAFQRLPPGWVLLYLHGIPHTWVIFSSPTTPSVPLSVKLGEQIELLGYDFTPRLDTDKRRLDLTLYWRAIAPPEKDYTLFLHLTAPDGFVKAQRDQPPFNGLWPTSQWQTGDRLADRYSIVLDEWLQPGEYLLLTGLYEPQSGQRLSLVNAPPAPAPNAILLEKIQLK